MKPSVITALMVVGLTMQIVSARAAPPPGESRGPATTRDLYELCSVPSDSVNYTAAIYECIGFIRGSVAYHDAVSDRKHLKRLICYPATATAEEGRRIFVAWVRSHEADGKRMVEPAVLGLVRSLAAKFPCTAQDDAG